MIIYIFFRFKDLLEKMSGEFEENLNKEREHWKLKLMEIIESNPEMYRQSNFK